ncbi:MAG: deoxyhypusine synthase [Thermoplasmata archaeon]|nr:MAG: deoxyhypusine synthase [Thermoplasmata archaeon]
MIPVKDIHIEKGMNIDALVKQFQSAGGFTARKISQGVELLEEMVKGEYVKCLSFPACIVATGTRGVIREIVQKKMVDVIITTCGTLDHDLARNWKDYYHGSFFMDDIELHKKDIHRLGNILIPHDSYGGIIEKKMQEILEKIGKEKKEWGTREIAWEIGKRLGKQSILYWAWKHKIPIYVPGITDGAVGSQIWMYSQSHPFIINLLKDEQELSDIFFHHEKKIGALIVGGGISKHHIIWWSQFHGGLDAAVYITSSPEWDGSLSGARTREAISWGKLKEKARHVTIEGDATVLLPLIIASLFERIDIR